jgi:hypothetical protein
MDLEMMFASWFRLVEKTIDLVAFLLLAEGRVDTKASTRAFVEDGGGRGLMSDPYMSS